MRVLHCSIWKTNPQILVLKEKGRSLRCILSLLSKWGNYFMELMRYDESTCRDKVKQLVKLYRRLLETFQYKGTFSQGMHVEYFSNLRNSNSSELSLFLTRGDWCRRIQFLFNLGLEFRLGIYFSFPSQVRSIFQFSLFN